MRCCFHCLAEIHLKQDDYFKISDCSFIRKPLHDLNFCLVKSTIYRRNLCVKARSGVSKEWTEGGNRKEMNSWSSNSASLHGICLTELVIRLRRLVRSFCNLEPPSKMQTLSGTRASDNAHTRRKIKHQFTAPATAASNVTEHKTQWCWSLAIKKWWRCKTKT
jgi:hypothetical protein